MPDHLDDVDAEVFQKLERDDGFDSSYLTEGYDAVIDMTAIFS